MLLTPRELRYIEICRLRAEGKTYDEIGEILDVSSNTIWKAQKFGEKYGLFAYEVAKKLQPTIARLRKHQQWLESKLKEHEAVIRKRKAAIKRGEKIRGLPALPVDTVRTFSRELIDVEMKIAELEGIYNRAVNLRFGGEDGGPLKIEVEVVRPDDTHDQDQ